LWEIFQTGAFADDHEDRNQIAAIAQQRGSRLLNDSLRGDRILVIGDTPRDIQSARHIGARALAVATGGAKSDELQDHRPDWLAEDLTKVKVEEVCLFNPSTLRCFQTAGPAARRNRRKTRRAPRTARRTADSTIGWPFRPVWEARSTRPV